MRCGFAPRRNGLIQWVHLVCLISLGINIILLCRKHGEMLISSADDQTITIRTVVADATNVTDDDTRNVNLLEDQKAPVPPQSEICDVISREPTAPFHSYQRFPRAMDRGEHATALQLLSTMDDLLSRNNISFVMYFGTLMGSYVMHDILPWDDDVDMVVPAEKKQDLLTLLKSARKFSHWDLDFTTYKFFVKVWFKNSPKSGGYPWGFPFIDVTFYRVNGSTVHGDVKPAWNVNVQDFFPLHKRPLGGICLTSPAKPVVLLRKRYKRFTCHRHATSHRLERRQKQLILPCKTLQPYYPYVVRQNASGLVNESLYLSDERIHWIVINETFVPNIVPYSIGQVQNTRQVTRGGGNEMRLKLIRLRSK